MDLSLDHAAAKILRYPLCFGRRGHHLAPRHGNTVAGEDLLGLELI
jgi:hypothetical protein